MKLEKIIGLILPVIQQTIFNIILISFLVGLQPVGVFGAVMVRRFDHYYIGVKNKTSKNIDGEP